MNTPFLSLTPERPTSFAYAIPVPEAYQAWSVFVSLAGCGGLQVLSVHELHKNQHPKETPIYLAEMITRTVFEAALVMEFDRVDNLLDVWMRARVREFFGPELERAALDLIASQCIGASSPIRLMPVTEPERPGASKMWTDSGIQEVSRVK